MLFAISYLLVATSYFPKERFMFRNIMVLDTTLRDGEQAPGFSMKLSEKLKLAKQLEKLSVDVIEAGFPISSPDDFAAVKEIAAAVKSCGVAGLSRLKIEDIDTTWRAIKHSERPRIHLFIATSDIHLEHKLRMSREQLLQAISYNVAYAKKLCADIQFSAEDATRTDREFLLKAVKAAEKAGANIINLPDTVGYIQPQEIAGLVKYMKESLESKTLLGVHCHDDLGLATANTLEAVKAGADQFEATIAGIGERAGMAALEEVVMALKTRSDYYGADTLVDTREFYKASKILVKNTEMNLPPNKAIIGDNAFAHESGIHQHAILKNPETYEIMQPEDVGIISTKLVLGKHSGRAAVKERLGELGYALSEKDFEDYFVRFKGLSDIKKNLTDTDIKDLIKGYIKIKKPYKLSQFVINAGTELTSTAVVELRHNGDKFKEVATGETAVIAAFNAVDKIISHSYPLYHFSIQSISSGRTELSESSVHIKCGDEIITGRGLSTDIVEACIKAYLNAINKALLRQNDLGKEAAV